MSSSSKQPTVVTVPIHTPSSVLLPNQVSAVQVPDQRPKPIPAAEVRPLVEVPMNSALETLQNYGGLKTSINYKIEDIEGQPVRGNF